MRRMIVAAVILFLIVAACLYESGKLESIYAFNVGELESIAADIEKNDLDGAKERFSLIKEKWSRDEETLDAIASHEDTDAVNIMITELGENMRQNNQKASLMTIDKLKLQFEHIYKRNQIKISNIL